MTVRTAVTLRYPGHLSLCAQVWVTHGDEGEIVIYYYPVTVEEVGHLCSDVHKVSFMHFNVV